MAYIEEQGGRPVTRQELSDHLFICGWLYPNEDQFTPIWVDSETKEKDWIQIGEGLNEDGRIDPGTSLI